MPCRPARQPAIVGVMAAKDVLGRRGEDLAALYLQHRGLVILSRNWRCREGELDLVATDASRLVVCEVKTRSSAAYGAPLEAVTAPKARRLRRLAAAWLRENRLRASAVRVDVVSILASPRDGLQIQHLRGVV